MFRSVFTLLALMFAVCVHAAAPPKMANSLVRIETTSQDPNYREPWNPGRISGGVGTGFVIAGQRILTNAHVVSDARFITVSKETDPHPYLAHILFVAHDCDLAVLTLDDPNFFQSTIPLELGGIPQIESNVTVYGYPIGGERLSVTRGIVSRIDFQTYTHSGIDSHLTIQIDAAINPGNSGGPVVQDGKVVGVAFQGYNGEVAQNVGYMIPTPVIKHFLKDIESGHYNNYMDLGMSYHPLFNPAARKALGLTTDDVGVYVGDVYTGGASDGIVKQGDVLLSIDGHPIASDAMIDLDGSRVQMAEVVERKFKGDSVTMDILRDGKPLSVTVPLSTSWPFALQANAYDKQPRFVVFGGLVFQPVDQNFMSAYSVQDLKLRYYFDHFITDRLYMDRPEIVVLSGILSDPINAYAGDFKFGIVDKINGHEIRRLADVSKAFALPADYYVIEMLGNERPLVLERKAVEAARERILSRYNVTKEENLEN